MQPRELIANALVEWITNNFPFRAYIINNSLSNIVGYTKVYMIPVWYQQHTDTLNTNDIPIAHIALEANEIYFSYGHKTHTNWPNTIILAYENPNLMDIIEDKLSNIVL